MGLFNKSKLIKLRDGRLLNVEHVELITDHHMMGNNTKRVRLTSGKWLDDLHVSDVPKIEQYLGVIKL